MQRAEKRAKAEIKAAANKNQNEAARILAKQVLNTRKTIGKLAMAKANMLDLGNEMKIQLATLRTVSSLQQSTKVSQAVGRLIKIPQLQASMKDMAREMHRAGLIQEQMDDVFSIVTESEDLEEDAALAVEQILQEVAGETLAKLAFAPQKKVPTSTTQEEDASMISDDLVQKLATG